jgi:large conductance mechanosensitive channel
MGLFKEFKEFALRGNMVDLAVGVVIGAAFGKVVTSLVNDIIMPPIGLITGGVDFSDKAIHLKDATLDATGKVLKPAVDMTYGKFINNIVDFVIVALAIFMVIKLMNAAARKKQVDPATAEPPPLTLDQQLLTDIRDSMKGTSRPA